MNSGELKIYSCKDRNRPSHDHLKENPPSWPYIPPNSHPISLLLFMAQSLEGAHSSCYLPALSSPPFSPLPRYSHQAVAPPPLRQSYDCWGLSVLSHLRPHLPCPSISYSSSLPPRCPGHCHPLLIALLPVRLLLLCPLAGTSLS